MSEKNILSRIQHKHDIEANWIKAVNFIPKKAELIVYDPDENFDYSRVKIGDGIAKVNSLPFHAGTWEEIADKPFEVVDKRVEILEETLLSSTKVDVSVELENDTEYIVILNDTEYRLTSFVIGDDILLGETDYWYHITDGTYPFGISTYNQQVGCDSSEIGSTIKILQEVKYIKYIDERVIPDTIARVADIPTGALADKDIVSKEDLDSSVQQSLDKADTAFQPSSYVNTNLSEWTKQMCEEAYADFQNGKAVIGKIWRDRNDNCQVICISGGWDNYESCFYLNFIRDNPYGNQELYSLYFGGLYTVYYVEKGERLYVPSSPTKDYVLTGTGTGAQWKELPKIEAISNEKIDEICNASIYAASEVIF